MTFSFQLPFLATILISCTDSKKLGDVLHPDSASGDYTLQIVTGNLQTVSPGSDFLDPLRVQLLAGGSPVEGETINFAMTSGVPVTFSNSSAVTDASGMASITATSGNSGGSTIVTASYLTQSVTFTLTTVSQDDSYIVLVSGNNQTVAPGVVLPQLLTVQTLHTGDNSLADNVLVRFSVVQGNGRIYGTSNTYDVTTNSLGKASVNFTAGTLAGVNSVQAQIIGNPSETVTFNANSTVSPTADVDINQTTIQANVASLQANGAATATLTLSLKDLYGNTVPAAGATVAFNATAGTLLGAVTDNGNGTYTQTLRAPASVGSGKTIVGATVTAAANNIAAPTPVPAANKLQLTLISGAFDLGTSTVSVSTGTINADGVSTSLVTVTLKDSLGNQLTSGGQTVALLQSPALGTFIGSINDNGNGTYSQVIRSTTTAGSITLSATVSGAPITQTATLTFSPGVPNPTTSTITASPTSISPNGTSTSIITVQLKDIFSNPLISGGATVTINTTSGTWAGPVVDNNDGSYQRVLISSNTPGVAQISATVGGQAITRTINVYFTTGTSGPSIVTSTLTTLGSNYIPANGASTITVKVSLKDSTGTQISSGGSVVSINSTAGTLLGSVVDAGDGTYTQILRAPSSSAVATLTATADGNTLNQTTTVYFYGSMSLSTSTVSAIPNSIEATGATTSLIVIQAKDSSGISIPVGGETGLALATTHGTLLGSLVDNNNGTYTQSLQSTPVSNTATVSATKGGVALSSTTTVSFFTANNLAGMTIDCLNIATHQNTDIVVDNGTLTMNSTGANGSCPNNFVFKTVTVRNNGILTHGTTTPAQEYGLEFTATHLTLDGSSKIDVSGKGYVASIDSKFAVQGNNQVNDKNGNATNSCGGTYGGEGGSGSQACAPSIPYGSIYEPVDLGASSAFSNAQCAFSMGSGGGRLKITITSGGSLINNGIIKSTGNSPTGSHACGAGSGGSIWIDSPTISGTGSINASGGGSGFGGGGGGGRIAIYYGSAQNNFSLPTNIVTNATACGGVGYAAGADGAAGTIYFKSTTQTYGDLVINNCSRTSVTTAKTLLSVPINALPDAISALSLTKAGLFADTYVSTRTPYKGYFIDPNINQVGTATKMSHTLFKVTSGSANTLNTSSGNMTTIANGTNSTFQLALMFDNVEITGRAMVGGNAPLVARSGDLQSNDAFTANIKGLPPVWFEIPNTNSISFDGTSVVGTFQPTFTNFGSANVTVKNGTFLLDNVVAHSLTLDNAAVTSTCLKGAVCITLSGALNLQNASVLSQAQTTTSAEYSLEISAGSLTVGSGTTISALGKGYSYAGSTYGHGTTFGNTNFIANVSGGNHAGRGGSNLGSVYGSLANPNESGGSGAFWGTSPGSGGGIIRINLSGGAASIDGNIDASGAVGSNGGAGGSVYLNVGAISGGGFLKANGGAAATYAGGGGGRVALYYTTTAGGFTYPTSILARLQAFGGALNQNIYGHGSAGTVFLKGSGQTYGDLYVNNNNLVTTASNYNTYLNIPNPGTSSALTATKLTSGAAFTELGTNTNHLFGFSVNPNTGQNSTATLSDDPAFVVTNQTGNDLTVSGGDMTTVGSAGNTYQVMLVLDNLEVSGKAILETSGPVLVRSGDITGNSTNTLNLAGILNTTGNTAAYEFHGLASGSLDAQTGTINLKNFSTTGPMTLTNGTFYTGTLTAGSLTIDNATVTPTCLKSTTCLNVTGALTLQNAATLVQKATTPSAEYALEIVAGSLNVNGGSTISAVGKGYVYAGAVTHGSTTYGNATYIGYFHGGSHGGRGSSASGATYGSIANPNESGASGGYYGAPGYGGGIIRIHLGGGTTTIDGTIDASGTGGGGWSGGAGGSVYLKAGTVSGGGILRANGGSAYYGSGGGGRIALYYSSAIGGFSYPTTILSRFQAYGGADTGFAYGNGAAGTIFLKGSGQTYGDLYVNNNSLAVTSNTLSTYLNIPAATTSSALTSSALTTGGGVFTEFSFNTNHLVGFSVNPNVGQNSSATLNDDTVFVVTSHTSDELTIASGDMTTVATGGNTFQVLLVLDNLEVTGKAILETTGPVLVKSGDISGNNTTTLGVSGGLIGTGTNAGFEFAGLNSGTLNAQSSIITLKNISTAGSLTLTNGNFNTETITSSSLTVDNATVTPTCLKSTQCVTISGALTLQNGANLVQRATTPTTEYALEISAGSLNVNSGTTISAVGKGYTYLGSSLYIGTTYGNVSYNSSSLSGGNHGGRGSPRNNSPTYGSLANPNESGASGIYYHAMPGPGGGIIRINLSAGAATIDGTIDAGASDGYSSGGAGGSVYLNVGSITGGGTIKANGGAAASYGSGGGGRIALYYNSSLGGFTYPTTILSRFQTYGGATVGYGPGAAGTVFLKNSAQTYGDLYINNNGQTSQANVSTYINIPPPSASTLVTATTLTSGSAFTELSLNSNNLVGFSINPNAAQNATPTLNDDTVFVVTSQGTNDLNISSGDLTTVGATGNTYQAILVLDNLELSGKGVLETSGPILVKSGDVNGNNTNATVAGQIIGTGNVEFVGVNTSTLNADGGSINMSSYTTTGNLTISGGTFNIDKVTVGGNLLVDSASTLVAGSTSPSTPNVTVTGDISVANSSAIKSKSTTSTTEYRLYVTAADIDIDGTSAIHADATGYVNQGVHQFRSLGNVNVDGLAGGSNAAGGSYGGYGGFTAGHATNEIYGNFKAPTDLGTSGGYAGGGTGGGALRLSATGTVTIDGIVSANGGTGALNSGGGSGGSVWITTGGLAGSGQITSNGGGTANGAHGGGGGGRIAVYYSSSSGSFAYPGLYAKINALGNNFGSTNGNGAAGTVYLFDTSSQTYGDLVINNNGINATNKTAFKTPLTTVSTLLNATSLVTSSAFANPYNANNQFLGLYVNPNIAQTATTYLTDKTFFPILSNTPSTLTTPGDMTTVASTGDTFKLVLQLDNLEVRQFGKLDFGTQQVLVYSGDLSSNDASSFLQDGGLTAGTVDLTNLVNWSTTINASGTVTTQCSQNFACP